MEVDVQASKLKMEASLVTVGGITLPPVFAQDGITLSKLNSKNLILLQLTLKRTHLDLCYYDKVQNHV